MRRSILRLIVMAAAAALLSAGPVEPVKAQETCLLWHRCWLTCPYSYFGFIEPEESIIWRCCTTGSDGRVTCNEHYTLVGCCAIVSI